MILKVGSCMNQTNLPRHVGIIFPKTLFPDFNEQEFNKALSEYQNRTRKFGGNI